MAQKLTTCFWFKSEAEEAALYYAKLFKSPAPSINRMPDGSVLLAHVDILGTTFLLLNGNDKQKPNDSISISIDCKDQAEVDYYWDSFVGDGGAESMCGWCKDKFGISWQIIPEALSRTMGGADRAGSGRAMQAMLKMRKLVVADLEAAYAGK
jgi:predicted 3-demethylubiquinone-9 3-methyltransferase (glyoxalase superfamily)